MENKMTWQEELSMMKGKIDTKNGVCLDEETLDFLVKKLDEIQYRIYSGFRKVFEAKLDVLEVKVDTIILGLSDKGIDLEEANKVKEIEEYMAKIKDLMGK